MYVFLERASIAFLVNLAIRDICNINLDTLLFGSDDLELRDNQKIFEAVQEYIKSSERFII